MAVSDFVQLTRTPRIPESEFRPAIRAMNRQIRSAFYPPPAFLDILPGEVRFNIITPREEPVPDCITCGACCAAFPVVSVGAESKIAVDDRWDVTIDGANGEIVVDRYMRRDPESLACVALDGSLGLSCSCRIYNDRPRTCSVFEAGSDRCRELRRAYGFEPPMTLSELITADEKLDKREMPPASRIIKSAKIIEQSDTGHLEIHATFRDESSKLLHVFDPAYETYFQAEFEELTLPRAFELIASRGGGAVAHC